jgi:hypothetical protein
VAIAFKNLGLILCLAMMFSSHIFSAEKEIEIGTIMSDFVWRGIRLGEGPVYQSSLTVRSRGFSFNIWGNFDLHSAGFSEIDGTVSYAREFKRFDLEAGLIHYGVIDGQDSDELYAGVTARWFLQPSLRVFFDVNAGRGAFIQASAGRSVALFPRVSMDLIASVGMVLDNRFMGLPDSGREFMGPHNAEILAVFPISLGKGWEVKLQVGASTPLSRESRQAIINSGACQASRFCNGTITYGGAGVAYAF